MSVARTCPYLCKLKWWSDLLSSKPLDILKKGTQCSVKVKMAQTPTIGGWSTRPVKSYCSYLNFTTRVFLWRWWYKKKICLPFCKPKSPCTALHPVATQPEEDQGICFRQATSAVLYYYRPHMIALQAKHLINNYQDQITLFIRPITHIIMAYLPSLPGGLRLFFCKVKKTNTKTNYSKRGVLQL